MTLGVTLVSDVCQSINHSVTPVVLASWRQIEIRRTENRYILAIRKKSMHTQGRINLSAVYNVYRCTGVNEHGYYCR